MRRIGLVLLTLLAPTLLVGFVIGTNLRNEPPPQGKDVLEAYLKKLDKTLTQPATSIARSSTPNGFVLAMSQSSYSDGWYYQTTHNLRIEQTQPTAVITIPDVQPDPKSTGAMRALLYPPIEAWCVEVTAAKASAPTYLVLAQHQDLYSAEWVVHELSSELSKSAETLNKIGCKKSL